MPNNKSKSLTNTSSKKSTRVSATSSKAIGPLPPYGVAIRDAIARGDVREMRQVATVARKYLKDVQAALDAMEKSVRDLES